MRSQTGPGRSEGSDESNNCTTEVEEEGNSTTQKSDNKSEPEPAESSGSTPGLSEPRLTVRTLCPYGKDCYRYQSL